MVADVAPRLAWWSPTVEHLLDGRTTWGGSSLFRGAARIFKKIGENAVE